MPLQALVVDDSASVRGFLRTSLQAEGFDVVEEGDGMQAYATACSKPFDLVIVDIVLPGVSGFALISALRGLPAYKTTPILVLTSDATIEAIAQGRERGATAWMTKPAQSGKIREVIRTTMRTIRANLPN